MAQPGIPLGWPDREQGMTHPQPRVAALGVVGPRAAPVLGKEETQVATRAGQVVRLGVDREQPWIARNARVEVIDEGDEEGQATSGRIDGGRFLVQHRQVARRFAPGGQRVAQRDRCQDLPSVWVDGA